MSERTQAPPRRIAVVSHSRSRVGGVETYVATVVPALRRAGYEVGCWFESTGDGAEQVVAATSDVPCWTAGEGADDGIAQLQAWQPDLVYAHGVVSPARERALLEMAPAVFFAHSYYGACISGTKSWRFPVRRSCQRTLGPGCLALYYPCRCGGLNPVTLAHQYTLQRDRLALLGSYARILVASQHMADEYARHGFAASVRVVPLPMESPQGSTSSPPGEGATPGRPSRPWRLLFLGRFEETKGAHVAIESAALVAASTGRAVHLQLSGEGSCRARLSAQAAGLTARHTNLRVVFTPWLSSEASIQALDGADLLLVPSLWPEPFGMVGVEAARRGVPAVAFAVGGIPDWLIDGTTGRLVPAEPPSPQAFARAIETTLSDETSWRRMRAACRAEAARFGLEPHLAALAAVFDEVGGTHGRAA